MAALSLYRATYVRADGSERHCTFADSDDASAQATARKYAIGDRLVSVLMDRPLQAPLLTLEG